MASQGSPTELADGTPSGMDKNKNFERAADKRAWKGFNRALAARTDEDKALYNGMGRELKSKFRAAWENDPTWEFIQIFKRTTFKSEENDTLRKTYKSFEWLKGEIGEQGAKNHIAAMEAAGRTKWLESAGITLYAWSEDIIDLSNSKKQEKEVVSSSTSAAHPEEPDPKRPRTLPAHAMPIPLMDAHAEGDTLVGDSQPPTPTSAWYSPATENIVSQPPCSAAALTTPATPPTVMPPSSSAVQPPITCAQPATGQQALVQPSLGTSSPTSPKQPAAQPEPSAKNTLISGPSTEPPPSSLPTAEQTVSLCANTPTEQTPSEPPPTDLQVQADMPAAPVIPHPPIWPLGGVTDLPPAALKLVMGMDKQKLQALHVLVRSLLEDGDGTDIH